MIDIVICVDGTNSHTYANSSVRNFHRSIQVPEENKIYHNGPKAHGGATGADWMNIRDEVIRRLDRIANRYGEKSFLNGYQCTVGRNPGFRFIMVGHSRGGHIVIHLAVMLRYRTYFMGLYDAVERTDLDCGDDFSQVIYNVDHVVHARRDLTVGSRTNGRIDPREQFYSCGLRRLHRWRPSRLMDFGNTGLKTGDGGAYEERLFQTSHGGVGGEVLTHTLFGIPVKDDVSCAITFFNQGEAQVKKSALCIEESIAADRWVRGSARKLGISI